MKKEYWYYKLEDGFQMEHDKKGVLRFAKGNKLVFTETTHFKYTDLGDSILSTTSTATKPGRLSPGNQYRIIGCNSTIPIKDHCYYSRSLDEAFVDYAERGSHAWPHELELLRKRKLEPIVEYSDWLAQFTGLLLESIDGCTYAMYFSEECK